MRRTQSGLARSFFLLASRSACGHNGPVAADAKHLTLGLAGEDAAARFLSALGWRMVARNWRPGGVYRGLELDLIARHEDTLIFVEVKTRKRIAGGIPPYAAFSRKKQENLVRAAECYLSVHKLWNMPCRFDLVCVEQGADGALTLEHHENAIELGHLVDSGDASWQPW